MLSLSLNPAQQSVDRAQRDQNTRPLSPVQTQLTGSPTCRRQGSHTLQPFGHRREQ